MPDLSAAAIFGGPQVYAFAETGETLALSPVLAAAVSPASGVGRYMVTGQPGSSISDKGNSYRLVYTGALTVTPADLTVTAGDGSSVYGDVPSVSGYTVSGWKNGQSDELLTGVSVTTTASATSDVGSAYTTHAANGTLTGEATGNYAIAYTAGQFKVRQRPVTLTADNLSRTYGDPTPDLTFRVTSGNLVNGDAFSGTLVSDAPRVPNVDTYDIKLGSLSAGDNYALTFNNGTYTVVAAPLTITANNGSMAYGDAVPEIGYAVSGWKLGQTDALLTGVRVTTDATPLSDIGTYTTTVANGAVLLGPASGNYAISHQDGRFDVFKRQVGVAADSFVLPVGAPLPDLSWQIVSGSVANDEDFSGELAITESGQGQTQITIGTLALPYPNYDLSFEPGTVTYEQPDRGDVPPAPQGHYRDAGPEHLRSPLFGVAGSTSEDIAADENYWLYRD